MNMETNGILNQFLEVLVIPLEISGKSRTASAYRSAVNSASRLLEGGLPSSELFTPEGLHLYEKRLYAQGMCNNTVSFYMRMLRAMYNKGVDLGLCPCYPGLFSHVYTGLDVTPKRAVSPDIFGRLQELDLSGKDHLAFACDMFLLSFSLQGISFVDLAFLRKSNLKDSLLTYHRVKTGSAITVALSPFSLEIIRKYASETKDSPYLLPIVKDPDGNVRMQYTSALRTYNRRLKVLGALGSIEENLTSYVARHSWATAARNENVPVGIISQAMGHKTEEITQIYLARYDHTALFLANQKVLAAANLIPTYLPVSPATGDSGTPAPAFSVRTHPDVERLNAAKGAQGVRGEGKTKNVRHLSGDGHLMLQT